MTSLSCSQCGNSFSVADDVAGKRTKCPNCGEILRAPATKSEEDLKRIATLGLPKSGEGQLTFKCAHCGNVNIFGSSWAGRDAWCRSCNKPFRLPGQQVTLSPPVTTKERRTAVESSRYPALDAMRGLLTVVAVLCVLGPSIMLLVAIISQIGAKEESPALSILSAFIVLAIGFLVAIPYWALANLIRLFMDVESNTRRTAELMVIVADMLTPESSRATMMVSK